MLNDDNDGMEVRLVLYTLDLKTDYDVPCADTETIGNGYYLDIIPLDQPGLKASGIMKVVVEAGKVYLGNDIKHTSDPSAKHESCDLCNPPKPVPAELRK